MGAEAGVPIRRPGDRWHPPPPRRHPCVEIERPAAEAGIAMLARGRDFANGVVRHEADRAKCDRLVTFDQGFARLLGPDKATLLETRPAS